MKKQKKSMQNGITLIALVITIIVMLILAGVSLSLVVGENGVLNKAQTAVVETKKGSVLEEAQMVLVEWQSDYLVSRTPYEGRTVQTQSGADVICTGGKVIVVDNQNAKVYQADFTNGERLGNWMEVSINAEDPATKQIYNAMNPKVPAGFTHIDGEWNTGFVIKETSTEDEFVWVPVVSETSYARKSGARNWHMSRQGENDCGKDVTQYILGDSLELSTILGTAITETQRSGETPANIPEAAVVNAAGGFYVSRYEIGINTRTSAATGNQSATDWEVGNLVSQAGKEPARNIQQVQALAAANAWKSGTDYQSGLITGTEWDAMCNFIGWSKCDSDCTSWGNYRNNLSKEFTNIDIAPTTSGAWTNMATWQRTANADGTRNVFQTGRFENQDGVTTDVKNIFDVAGNVWEWTTEMPTQDATHRVLRGGSAYRNGNDHLATYRYGGNSATYSSWGFGFRAVLYVK